MAAGLIWDILRWLFEQVEHLVEHHFVKEGLVWLFTHSIALGMLALAVILVGGLIYWLFSGAAW